MTKRPLVFFAISYIAGIIAAGLFLKDPAKFYVWVLAFLIILVITFLWRHISLPVFMVAVLSIVFLAGFISFRLAVTPPPGGLSDYAGRTVSVVGTVTEEPRRDEGYTTYRLRVESVETAEGSRPLKSNLLARVYHGEEGAVYWIGERLRLEGEIVEAKGQRNPGGFDYRFYLRTQGVDALMYLQPRHVASLGEGEVNPLATSALTLRSRMIEGIESSLPSPQAELLAAILFGQRHLLPEDVQENFIRSGTNHLMAVSGLHVGLVAALLLGLFKKLRLKGPLFIILAIFLLFAYAYITGMRPAALRAALMFSTGLVALMAGREKDFPSAIALAGLITLAYNPLLLFTVGFQLSYVATLSIFYFYPFFLKEVFYRLPSNVAKLLSVTIAAQLGALPLSAYYFHQFPVAALFFNILLLPLMVIVVATGLLAGLLFLIWPLPASLIHFANLPFLSYMVWVASLAKAPWVLMEINPPALWLLLAYYLFMASFLAIYYRHIKKSSGKETDENFLSMAVLKNYYAHIKDSLKLIIFKKHANRILITSLLLITVFVWGGVFAGNPSGITVYYIDVGQGSATYVETSCGFNMLIDAGGEPPYLDPEKKGRIGEKVLLPFLRNQGVKELDLVVITHPHEDHFGGIFAVLNNLTVNHIMISPVPGESGLYQEMLFIIDEQEIPVKKVSAGDFFSPCDPLSLQIISPSAELYRGTRSDLNNNSVVLRLEYGAISFLFTGDIEEEAIKKLLRDNADISADILQVPHHGGFFESATPFIKAVSPQLAVIQVGRNTFGHPHPYITETLNELGIEFYRNDLHGAVIINADQKTFNIKKMLKANTG